MACVDYETEFTMCDISQAIGQAKVAQVVNVFYDRVVLHPQLKAPFAIVQDWTRHKQHLTHFWWVTLGGERYLDYQYQVRSKHESAGFTPELLLPWLDLFRATVRELVAKDLCEAWIERAEHIGKSLILMFEFSEEQKTCSHSLSEPKTKISVARRPA